MKSSAFDDVYSAFYEEGMNSSSKKTFITVRNSTPNHQYLQESEALQRHSDVVWTGRSTVHFFSTSRVFTSMTYLKNPRYSCRVRKEVG